MSSLLEAHPELSSSSDELTFTYDEALGHAMSGLVRAYRLRQQDLAPMFGLSRAVVGRKLSGHTTWTAEEVSLMSDLFGVSTTDVMPIRTGDGWAPPPFPDKAKAPTEVRAMLDWYAIRDSNPGPTDSGSAWSLLLILIASTLESLVRPSAQRCSSLCGPAEAPRRVEVSWPAEASRHVEVSRRAEVTRCTAYYPSHLRFFRECDPMAKLERWPVPIAWEEPINRWTLGLRARGLRPQSIHTRELHIRSLARALKTPPREITADALTEWSGGQSWSANTRASHYATFRSFFSSLWREDPQRSPAALLGTIRRPVGKPRPAPTARIQEAIKQTDDRTGFLIRLTAEYGLRIGEAVLVHLKDLFPDLDGTSLLVHGKGGKERYVPLARNFSDALVHYIKSVGGGWAFPGQKDGHLSGHWAGILVRRAMNEDYSAHQLRHRFGTTAYEVDHDLLAVADLMGHASTATTRGYVQIPRSQLAQVIARTSLTREAELGQQGEQQVLLQAGGDITVTDSSLTVTGTDGASLILPITRADLADLFRVVGQLVAA